MLDADVYRIIEATFEEMAFLDVTVGGLSPSGPPSEGPWLSLSYTRPQPGLFALFLPKPLRYAVAEAVYGVEPRALTSSQLDDSLLELLNVLGGRLLSERWNGSQPHTMGLPVVSYDPPEVVEPLKCRDFPCQTDGHEFTLRWYEVAE